MSIKELSPFWESLSQFSTVIYPFLILLCLGGLYLKNWLLVQELKAINARNEEYKKSYESLFIAHNSLLNSHNISEWRNEFYMDFFCKKLYKSKEFEARVIEQFKDLQTPLKPYPMENDIIHYYNSEHKKIFEKLQIKYMELFNKEYQEFAIKQINSSFVDINKL